eukprot:7861195-Lingulodinium_polyedra.AAC.1
MSPRTRANASLWSPRSKASLAALAARVVAWSLSFLAILLTTLDASLILATVGVSSGSWP